MKSIATSQQLLGDTLENVQLEQILDVTSQAKTPQVSTTDNSPPPTSHQRQEAEKKPTNRGEGAGGANTNVSGLSFEAETNMSSMYKVIQKNEHSQTVRFHRSRLIFETSSKGNFEKMMQSRMDINGFVEYISKPKADGTKEPDETFVFRNKIIHWWEKRIKLFLVQ